PAKPLSANHHRLSAYPGGQRLDAAGQPVQCGDVCHPCREHARLAGHERRYAAAGQGANRGCRAEPDRPEQGAQVRLLLRKLWLSGRRGKDHSPTLADLTRNLFRGDRHSMAPQHRTLIAKRRGLTFWTQWAVGMLLVCLLLTLLVQARYGTILSQYRVLGILTLLGSVHAYALLQVYHKRHRLLSGLLRLLAGWFLLIGSLLTIAVVTHTLHHYSLDLVFSWAVLGFVAQVLSYVPLHLMNRLHARKLRNERRSVIVGTGPLADRK